MKRLLAGLIVILCMPIFMLAGALMALFATSKTLTDIFSE